MKTFVCKLLLFLTAVLVPYNALAYRFYGTIQLDASSIFSDEGWFYHIVSNTDRTVEVIMPYETTSTSRVLGHNYEHAGQSLAIPSRCIGFGLTYKVIGIGRCAFMLDQAKEITLPPTISYISDFAFSSAQCETINIPAACSYISESAFRNCSAFPNPGMVVSEAITKINQINIDNQRYSFINGCLYCADKFNDKTHNDGNGKPKSLMNFIPELTNHTNIEDAKTLNLPCGIEHIFESGFECQNNHRRIIIPNSVDTIGPKAFVLCDLEEISLPTGLKHISEYLFYNCYNLKNIDVPNGAISIGESSFAGCKALQKVIIPDGMISIGESAFRDCTGLTEITIPESITSIGAYAFAHSLITHLELPDGIETLEQVFGYCVELNTIKLPRNLKSLNNSWISYCPKLRKLFCPMETPVPSETMFATDILKNATLYVPAGCKEAYEKVDPWRNFWNIEEYTPTVSVEVTESEPTKSIIGTYDLNGRAVAKDAPGIKIVRYSDGSVRKSVNSF